MHKQSPSGYRKLEDKAELMPRTQHVRTTINAITLVAIGTSLPELVTAVTALVKRQGSMSVGNILGANLIDITIILPLCYLLSQDALPVPASSSMLDLPIMLLEAGIAVIPTIFLKKFTRLQGLCMVVLYCCYLTYSIAM